MKKCNVPCNVFFDSSGDFEIAERHDNEWHQEVHHSVDQGVDPLGQGAWDGRPTLSGTLLVHY
jgi:hypothetical protein